MILTAIEIELYFLIRNHYFSTIVFCPFLFMYLFLVFVIVFFFACSFNLFLVFFVVSFLVFCFCLFVCLFVFFLFAWLGFFFIWGGGGFYTLLLIYNAHIFVIKIKHSLLQEITSNIRITRGIFLDTKSENSNTAKGVS